MFVIATKGRLKLSEKEVDLFGKKHDNFVDKAVPQVFSTYSDMFVLTFSNYHLAQQYLSAILDYMVSSQDDADTDLDYYDEFSEDYEEAEKRFHAISDCLKSLEAQKLFVAEVDEKTLEESLVLENIVEYNEPYRLFADEIVEYYTRNDNTIDNVFEMDENLVSFLPWCNETC